MEVVPYRRGPLVPLVPKCKVKKPKVKKLSKAKNAQGKNPKVVIKGGNSDLLDDADMGEVPISSDEIVVQSAPKVTPNCLVSEVDGGFVVTTELSVDSVLFDPLYDSK